MKRSSSVLAAVAILAGLLLAAPPAGASVRQQAPGVLGLRATPGVGSVTLTWNPVAERFRVVDLTGPDAVLLADGVRATSFTLFGVPAGVTRTFAVRALGLPGVVATVSATPTAADPAPAGTPVATGRRPAAGTPMASAPAAPRVRTRRGHVTLALPPAGRGSRLVVFRAPRTGMYRRLAGTRRRLFVDRGVTAGDVVRYRIVRVSARGLASAASRAITVRVRPG